MAEARPRQRRGGSTSGNSTRWCPAYTTTAPTPDTSTSTHAPSLRSGRSRPDRTRPRDLGSPTGSCCSASPSTCSCSSAPAARPDSRGSTRGPEARTHRAAVHHHRRSTCTTTDTSPEPRPALACASAQQLVRHTSRATRTNLRAIRVQRAYMPRHRRRDPAVRPTASALPRWFQRLSAARRSSCRSRSRGFGCRPRDRPAAARSVRARSVDLPGTTRRTRTFDSRDRAARHS